MHCNCARERVLEVLRSRLGVAVVLLRLDPFGGVRQVRTWCPKLGLLTSLSRILRALLRLDFGF